MTEQSHPPAGWYPVGDSERFWDGRAWTGRVRAPAPASGESPPPTDVHGFRHEPQHGGATHAHPQPFRDQQPAPDSRIPSWPAPQPHTIQPPPWGRPIAPGAWVPRSGFAAHGLVAPKNPALSLVASFLVPGLGSMLNGDVARGLRILVGYAVSWLLIIVFVGIFGVLGFWIWGMVDAYQGAHAWNARHGFSTRLPT
ncbi:DUF2510 domain-containing protein [Intrasporangium sp. DVR]|uniref:DUF2510 domain-containing protein n=1 Tax=Intrasporangium sp. DVR TaxID=3127867 RepID=UPI00313A5538